MTHSESLVNHRSVKNETDNDPRHSGRSAESSEKRGRPQEDQLEQSAGVAARTGDGTATTEKRTPVQYHDLDHLAGLWAKEEAAEFDKALDAQRKIDEGLWKRTK